MKIRNSMKKLGTLALSVAMIFSIASSNIFAYADENSQDEENRSYTVRHVLQDLDGDYSIVQDEETLTGVVGEMTNATAKTYEGFTAQDNIGNQLIGETGDIVITIKYSRNSYYITWVDGYSSTNYVSRYLYGETIFYPNDPVIDGHEFIGWFDYSGTKISEETMPSEDITAIAKYSPNLDANYKVEYYVQNATDPLDANDDEKTYSLANAISSGVGAIDLTWSDISSNYDSYTLNAMPFIYNATKTEAANEDIAIKADNTTVFKVYFDRPVITIKMNYWKNGLKANSIEVGEVKGLYGASTADVKWPTYIHEEGEDESWDGDYYWMIVANSGSIVFSGNAPDTFSASSAYIKQNDDGSNVITLASYASYAKYYKTTSTGGNTEPKTQYSHFEGLEDNTWIDELTLSKKLGNYTTAIAITESGVEGFTTAAGQWGTFTGDISQASIDFTYYWNKYNHQAVTLNWTDANGLPVYAGSSSKFINHDAHIYYTRNSYTLSFTNVGNDISDKSVKYQASLLNSEPNVTLTPPSYMDSESVFEGWYYDTDYENPVNWKQDIMPANDVTLVAKWSLPQKTVTLIDEDQTLGTISVTKYDTIYKTLDAEYSLNKEGYTFLGWYKDEACTKPFVYTEQITDNITLYAKWASSNETIFNYTVEYVDTDGNQIADSVNGKIAKDSVLYLESISVDGYKVQHAYQSQNLTVSEDNMTVKFIYDKLGRITISPVSMTAYVGGISQNGSHAPKLRYLITTPEGVSQTNLSFDVHIVKDGKETEEHLNRSLLDQESDDSYALFPELGFDLGNVDDNDYTVLRSNYLKVVDKNEASEAYSGVYDIEVRSNATADWDSFYITATDGQLTYFVDIDTTGATITIREVSDESLMYDDPFALVTAVVNDEESLSQSNDISLRRAIAVIPKSAKLLTNDDESLGLLGTNEVASVAGYGDESPLIALLFDDTVSLNSNISATTLESMMIKYAEDKNKESYDSYSKEIKYLDLVNVNDGNAVVTSSETITVYWPYPEGITYDNASDYTFKMLHYVGMKREAIIQSSIEEIDGLNIENVEVTPTEYGLKFTIGSFSPFALLWQANDNTPIDENLSDEEDPQDPTDDVDTQEPTDEVDTEDPSDEVGTEDQADESNPDIIATTDDGTQSSVPKTADNSNISLTFSLSAISILSLIILLINSKKQVK